MKKMKTEKTANKGSGLKKFLSCVLFFVGCLLLISETYAMIAQIVPYVVIRLYQMTGISVASGLTFAEFSVGDMVVMIMMWLMPSLCAVGLICAAQWKFICFVVRKLCMVLRNGFKKNVVSNGTTDLGVDKE